MQFQCDTFSFLSSAWFRYIATLNAKNMICRDESDSFLENWKKSGKTLEFNVENCVGTLLMYTVYKTIYLLRIDEFKRLNFKLVISLFKFKWKLLNVMYEYIYKKEALPCSTVRNGYTERSIEYFLYLIYLVGICVSVQNDELSLTNI